MEFPGEEIVFKAPAECSSVAATGPKTESNGTVYILRGEETGENRLLMLASDEQTVLNHPIDPRVVLMNSSRRYSPLTPYAVESHKYDWTCYDMDASAGELVEKDVKLTLYTGFGKEFREAFSSAQDNNRAFWPGLKSAGPSTPSSSSPSSGPPRAPPRTAVPAAAAPPPARQFVFGSRNH